MRRFYYYFSLFLFLFACTKDDTTTPEPEPVQVPKYTVTIKAGNGGTVSSAGGTFNKDSEVSVTATPNAEYLFEAWSDGSTDNPRTIKVGADLTITANFVKKQYDLTVTVVGDGAVAEEVVIQGGRYNSGSQIKLTATAAEGWEFSSWTGDIESTDNTVTVNINEAKEVTATFIRKKYDLTITIEGEGTVTEEVVIQGGRYNSGSQIKLTATAAEGWEFSSWTGDIESTDNTVTVNLTEAKDVTATFIRKTFNIQINVSGNGIIVINNPSEEGYVSGYKIQLIPNADDEWCLGSIDVEFNCETEACSISAAIWAAETLNNSNKCISELPELSIYSEIIVNASFVRNRDNDEFPDAFDDCPLEGGEYLNDSGCPLKPIRLAENGVTIVAEDWAEVGDSTEINGITYTVVDEGTLRQIIREKGDISKVCTTKVTDMSNLLAYTEFNRDISSWDVSNVTNMSELFIHSYFDGDISEWDVSNVTDMTRMFSVSFFKGDISKWDVSKVQNMSYMFSGRQINDYENIRSFFKGDISKWDVSNVINMKGMFLRSEFTGDISEWDTYNVKDMSLMFAESKFNGDISQWDVSNVEDMSGMFMGLNSNPPLKTSFNNDISEWNVSNVRDMSLMFHASIFKGDISKWDVSNVRDMSSMFSASEFNGDISQWDVSNVSDMSGMFGASIFTGNIAEWNVSNVTDMARMFSTSKFNGDISKWDVSNVVDMYGMFAGFNSPRDGVIKSSFNGDISNWDVSNVTDMTAMFYYSIYNQDISDWNVSNVRKMTLLFSNSQINQDLSNWEVDRVIECENFSQNTPQWNLPKPNFTNCTP